MSPSFIKNINFEQSSVTIKLYKEDEIKDTDESIDLFCDKLDQVVDTHLFLKKLDNDCLKIEDALKMFSIDAKRYLWKLKMLANILICVILYQERLLEHYMIYVIQY